MSLPGLFPIYPDPVLLKYNVSLSLPSVTSEISKSIGITSSTSFLMPNIEFLQKFVEGDIGIANNILKDTLFSNFNSPVTQKNGKVFKGFAKASGVEITDINKYKDASGKLKLPKEEINLPIDNGLGVKAFEKTLLTSIFETQKPYIEIIKLVLENIVKIEDIVARVMPLLGIPLETKSLKPSVNNGNYGSPKALGYQGGADMKKAVNNLNDISKQGKKLDSEKKSEGKSDLPAETKESPSNEDINIGDDDPYIKYKPEKIILGIFKSDGTPLDPNEKIKTIGGVDALGNIILTDTNFNKADWILKSKKWKLHDLYPNKPNKKIEPLRNVWPSIGSPVYKWTNKIGITQDSETKPEDGWIIKKYKKGDNNLIDPNTIAIEGNLMIVSFNNKQTTEYKSFFKDIVDYKMYYSDLDSQKKIEYSNEILNKLNIQSHVENVFLYSQNKTNVYKAVNGKPAFPDIMRSSFKPFQIWSEEALADEKISNYNKSIGVEPGFIWVDPESDYDTKVIRIDPTTKVEFIEGQGEPKLKSIIKSFVKNRAVFQFSNDIEFDIKITKNREDSIFYQNIKSYTLENWNYFKEDILSNTTPVIQNDNSYSIEISSIFANKNYSTKNSEIFRNGNIWTEIAKTSTHWTYKEFEFKSNTTYNDAITEISGNQTLLSKLYNDYLSNNSAVYTYGSFSYTQTIELKIIFETLRSFKLTENGIKTLNDGSLVEVNNNIIKRWIYHRDIYDVNKLPQFGKEIVYTINYNSELDKTTYNYPMTSSDKNIPLYSIKVEDIDFPYGKIIDPSEIANDFLSADKLFSNGRYGIGNSKDPQNIEVIKRYMLTDLDTESYYVIEGVLNDKNISISNVTSDSNYYKLPQAFGAMKVFVSLLADVFSKLIPNIINLIELLKDPATFITDIIADKMGEGFSIFSKDSFKTFELAKAEQDKNKNEKPSKKIKAKKEIFNNSQLSNFVFIDNKGDHKFLLDGVSQVPLKIFNKDIPLGMEIQFNNLPESPIKFNINSVDPDILKNVIDPNILKNIDTNIKIDTNILKNTNISTKVIEDSQPLIKSLMGFVTIPIKIISEVLEWLINFFKGLVNPLTLPTKIIELLSFSWLTDLFMPTTILKFVGIEYNPKKIAEWVMLSKIPKGKSSDKDIDIDSKKKIKLKYKDANPSNRFLIPDDYEIADLNEVIKMPFMMKLPTYTARQLRNNPTLPFKLMAPPLGLTESIIKSIINLIWSLIGLEALIPAPNIKLNKSEAEIENMIKDIDKQIVNYLAKDNLVKDENTNEQFIYDITLNDGSAITGLTYEEMQQYTKQHNEIDYKYNF